MGRTGPSPRCPSAAPPLELSDPVLVRCCRVRNYASFLNNILGEVYLAQDTKLDRKVVIKFLNEEFSKDAARCESWLALKERLCSAALKTMLTDEAQDCPCNLSTAFFRRLNLVSIVSVFVAHQP